jgi:hypothetical protein
MASVVMVLVLVYRSAKALIKITCVVDLDLIILGAKSLWDRVISLVPSWWSVEVWERLIVVFVLAASI